MGKTEFSSPAKKTELCLTTVTYVTTVKYVNIGVEVLKPDQGPHGFSFHPDGFDFDFIAN